jgi:uncharacterized cupredoxin-like copper-binding protein
MTSGTGGGTRRRPPRSLVRLLTCSLALGAVLLPASARAQVPVIVRVQMQEFTFQPATIRLTAGRPVRLVLMNQGQIAHQFETTYLHALPVRVVGDALSADAPGLDVVRLNPGGTGRVEFLPRRRGRFVFACTIEGHKEAGMLGSLEVR